jgi:hypothetical protein
MPIDAFIAIVFVIFWSGLAVAMFIGFRWMRRQERDTRLAEEVGLEPRLEVFGAGRINQRQWSSAHGCRLSVYDKFLVISVSSQRRRVPLYLIREVTEAPDAHHIIIKGLTEDESLLSIEFRGEDAERLAAYLREHGRGTRVAGPV